MMSLTWDNEQKATSFHTSKGTLPLLQLRQEALFSAASFLKPSLANGARL
jgi:hypothetical protein